MAWRHVDSYLIGSRKNISTQEPTADRTYLPVTNKMTDIPNLEFSEAVKADITALAEINTICYIPQAISAFFFSDWPDITSAKSYFVERVAEKFRDQKTQVIKLTNTESGEIIGFVCLSLSENEDLGFDIENPGGNFDPAIDINLEFAKAVSGKLDELEDLFKGTKHLCKS